MALLASTGAPQAGLSWPLLPCGLRVSSCSLGASSWGLSSRVDTLHSVAQSFKSVCPKREEGERAQRWTWCHIHHILLVEAVTSSLI